MNRDRGKFKTPQILVPKNVWKALEAKAVESGTTIWRLVTAILSEKQQPIVVEKETSEYVKKRVRIPTHVWVKLKIGSVKTGEKSTKFIAKKLYRTRGGENEKHHD